MAGELPLHLREARQPLGISLLRRSFEASLEQLQTAARDDEASKLIVPAYERTAKALQDQKIITKEPSGAYTTEITDKL